MADALKGVAILLMLTHHAFGLPTLIREPAAYFETIPGVPLEYWLGRFGKICVSIFLLLSGFGFATRFFATGTLRQRYFLIKAGRFLAHYWAYFALALCTGLAFFQERMANGVLRFPDNAKDIFLNAITVKNQMAFEWWFAETYLLLVLSTGLLLQAARWPKILFAHSSLAFLLGASMDCLRFDPTPVSFANLLIWQWPWVIGIIAARFADHRLPLQFAPKPFAIALALMVGVSFVLVELALPQAMTPFLICSTPFVMMALLWGLPNLADGMSGALLQKLGRLSLGLWLVHPFFCYYFAQNLVYAPRYAPLVFGTLLALSLAVVLCVEALRARALLPGKVS